MGSVHLIPGIMFKRGMNLLFFPASKGLKCLCVLFTSMCVCGRVFCCGCDCCANFLSYCTYTLHIPWCYLTHSRVCSSHSRDNFKEMPSTQLSPFSQLFKFLSYCTYTQHHMLIHTLVLLDTLQCMLFSLSGEFQRNP